MLSGWSELCNSGGGAMLYIETALDVLQDPGSDKIEWYVCDEPNDHTRYFVIQGSVGMHHWLVNLPFDPVIF